MRAAAALAALLWVGVLSADGAFAQDTGSAQNAPSPSASAAPRRRQVDRAVKLHDEAKTLYLHGEYRRAIAKLEEAIQLDPDAKELVYNLGLLHEKLLEFDEAEAYYRKYLGMEQDPKLVDRVQTTLKRIEGARRELERKRAEAAPVAAPAPSASPGAAPPPAPASEPPAPARTRPHLGPSFWVAGGVAIAGAAVGTIFAVAAIATKPNPDTRTGGGVTVDQLRDAEHTAHTRAIIADVSFLVGALATGVAVYVYVTRPRSDARLRGAGASRAADALRVPVIEAAFAPARGDVRVHF